MASLRSTSAGAASSFPASSSSPAAAAPPPSSSSSSSHRMSAQDRAEAASLLSQLLSPLSAAQKHALLMEALDVCGPDVLKGLEEARDAILCAAVTMEPGLLGTVQALLEPEDDGEDDEEEDDEEEDGEEGEQGQGGGHFYTRGHDDEEDDEEDEEEEEKDDEEDDGGDRIGATIAWQGQGQGSGGGEGGGGGAGGSGGAPAFFNNSEGFDLGSQPAYDAGNAAAGSGEVDVEGEAWARVGMEEVLAGKLLSRAQGEEEGEEESEGEGEGEGKGASGGT